MISNVASDIVDMAATTIMMIILELLFWFLNEVISALAHRLVEVKLSPFALAQSNNLAHSEEYASFPVNKLLW